MSTTSTGPEDNAPAQPSTAAEPDPRLRLVDGLVFGYLLRDRQPLGTS